MMFTQGTLKSVQIIFSYYQEKEQCLYQLEVGVGKTHKTTGAKDLITFLLYVQKLLCAYHIRF